MVTLNNEELLAKLSELVNNKPSFSPVQSSDLFEAFLRADKRSSETVRTYKHQFRPFLEAFPVFPSDHIKLNELIANLKVHNKFHPKEINKDASNKTKLNTVKLLRALVHFAHKNFKYPDYSDDLIKIPSKDPNQGERPYKSPEDLMYLINSCTTDLHKLIILTLIDSACRIGELGITKEHDGLTAERVHPDTETIEIYGKTGYHRMHCRKSLCLSLLANKSENGHIFHTKRQPNGMTAGALTDMVRDIFLNAFKSGPKMGAHTIRHSIASYLADLTGQPLVVQNFLKHSKIDMSMEYIHASDERKMIMPSPLNLMEEKFSKPITPIKLELLSENPTEQSTALSIYNESVEKVEATIDFSEKMFNEVPKVKHTYEVNLNDIDLNYWRKAFVEYKKNASPDDPIPSKIAQRWNQIFRKSKI